MTNWPNHGTKRKRIWQYNIDGFQTLIKPVGDIIVINSNSQVALINDYGFDIELRRLVQPYIFQYYFPSAAIVAVSHISFIIPLNSIPGRVGLVVTQFLTLTNIFIYQMSSSPSGATLTALGYYLLVSLSFVLFTMIEFAIVLFVKRKLDNTKIVSTDESRRKKEKEIKSFFASESSKKVDTWFGEAKTHNYLTDKIDYSCLFVSMASYLLFNIVYFIYYIYY